MSIISQTIILSDISTFPREILELLSLLNNEIINNENSLKKNEFWYESDAIINFKLSNIFSDISKLLDEKDPYISTYHVTVLLDYEVDDIKRNGLFLSDYGTITEKILATSKKKIFTINELEELKNNIAVRTQNPSSLIYSYTSMNFLISDNQTEMNFNQYWGGESISWYITENDNETSVQIKEKLHTLGLPYVIELVSKYSNYEFQKGDKNYNYKDQINELILLSYISDQLNIEFPTKIYGSISTSFIPIVQNVIPFSKINGLN